MNIFILVILLLIFYFIKRYQLIRYILINVNPEFNLNYNFITRVNKLGKTIITLTTIPARIESSKYTIASLLTQTRRVDEIRLYVPYKTHKGEGYTIPTWLRRLQKKLPTFKIKRCDKDWGPATKLIPALIDEQEFNTSIIYVDDDIVYHSQTVETLVSFSNLYPKTAICNAGMCLKKIRPNIDILEGFSGVIVKPSFFSFPKIFNLFSYPKEVFFQDDVYFSGMLSENNIPRLSTCSQLSVPKWNEFIYGFIFRCQPFSLSSTVNRNNRNLNVAVSCFKW